MPAALQGILTGSFLTGQTSIIERQTRPAPICSISSHARSIARAAWLASSPFSKRDDASVRNPTFFAARRTETGSNVADSSNTAVV